MLGPATAGRHWSLAESEAYCRRLARNHYENFRVASWLLPAGMRQHFCNVYAYCRWSDDLADEASSADASMQLLEWWQAELEECFRGRARHPVFVALSRTIAEFAIPMEPFAGLFIAFRQDQVKRRYRDHAELFAYCRHSANPVGRLVLHLARSVSPETTRLADSICTGLQLANFWQDIARDWRRGRRYLPDEMMRRFGCEEAFDRCRATPAFRAALAEEVARAEGLLRAGEGLPDLLPRQFRLDVWLFVQGGLAILGEIRRLDYDVWSRRPTVSRGKQLRLLASGWWRQRWGARR